MASSLSIVSALPATSAGASSPTTAPAGGFGNLLALLVGLLGQAKGTPSAASTESTATGAPFSGSFGLSSTSTSETALKFGGIDIGAALAALFPGAFGDTSIGEAVAAPSDASSAQATSPTASTASAFTALIDALRALEGPANGGPEDTSLLDRLEQAVDAVLAVLNPAATPSTATTTASPSPAPVDASVAPVPLAAQIVADSRAASATPDDAATVGVVGAQPPDAPLADKLQQLADAMRQGGLEATALAKLGLTTDAAPALERIEKAVTALLAAQTSAVAGTAPPQSDFAKVHLSMPPPRRCQAACVADRRRTSAPRQVRRRSTSARALAGDQAGQRSSPGQRRGA